MNAWQIRFAVFILPFMLGGCFTSSVLQTAKPLEKGTGEFSCGLVGYASESEAIPGINTMLRVGIGMNSDIGLGYAMGLGHLRLDYKYNFYRSADGNRFMSTGFGLDYFSPDFEAMPIPAVNIPFYFSVNHKGNVIPYFAQRFTFGLNDVNVLSGGSAVGEHRMYYMGGAGIRYGHKRIKGYVELSYSVDRVRYRHFSYNAANQQALFDNVHSEACAELNVGISFTFTGRKAKKLFGSSTAR